MPAPPPVDRAVSGSLLLSPLGIVVLIAALGLFILGSRHVGGLIRGLDQGAAAAIPAEPPPVRTGAQ